MSLQFSDCVAGIRTGILDAFDRAIKCDRDENPWCRESELNKILPEYDVYGNDFSEKANKIPRFGGKSRGDLRLTMKAWIFGKAVKQRRIQTLEASQNWLRKNLSIGAP